VPFVFRRLSSQLESRCAELALLHGAPAMAMVDLVGEPAAVAFAVAPCSPMGFCLQAVDPGTPGALTLAQAQQRCRAGGAVAGGRR